MRTILIWLLAPLLAAAGVRCQPVTSASSRIELHQISPPLPAPLIATSAATVTPSFPTAIPNLTQTSPLTLNPGTYRLVMVVSVTAWKGSLGTSGAIADAECLLDLGSGVAMVLPSSRARIQGCLTELPGFIPNQTCYWTAIPSDPWYPLVLPDDALLLRSQQPLVGIGVAWSSGHLAATQSGNLIQCSGRAIASSFYSALPPLHTTVDGTVCTAYATIELDFAIVQSTSGMMTGTSTCALQGDTQQFPVIPEVGYQFANAPTAQWFDPPLALGYEFQQTGASLFNGILTLPIGIDGDGLFEVQVGNQSLGQFAEGAGVDFVQLLGGGVPSFRIIGIDPAIDAVDGCFPVKLAFDTPSADFTMTPVAWRAVGASCSDPVCASCPNTSIAPIGDAVEGNLTFGLGVTNGPTGGAAGFFIGLGSASQAPFPLFCGSVLLPLQNAFFDVGATLLPGTGTCDGAGSITLPLVPTPPLYGLFLTAQAITLCPQAGLGLTHAIEFPIGN